jgi:hypothetical protein
VPTIRLCSPQDFLRRQNAGTTEHHLKTLGFDHMRGAVEGLSKKEKQNDKIDDNAD